jgi:hypothetical protein
MDLYQNLAQLQVISFWMDAEVAKFCSRQVRDFIEASFWAQPVAYSTGTKITLFLR